MRAFVQYDPRQRLFAVRSAKSGEMMAHTEYVTLKDATFRVEGEAGVVEGELVGLFPVGGLHKPVACNPVRCQHFYTVEDCLPVRKAPMVEFHNGLAWVKEEVDTPLFIS